MHVAAELTAAIAINGVTVICGGDTHTALLLSTDPVLPRQAATQLNIA